MISTYEYKVHTTLSSIQTNDVLISICTEIAAQFLTSSTDSDTDSLSGQDGWEAAAAAAAGNSDDEYPDTPTRNRRTNNYVGGNSGSAKGDKFSRGTIPVPSTGLLFSNQATRTRPPDSIGSIFGTSGRMLDVRSVNGRVGDLMENGGRGDVDGDIFMDTTDRIQSFTPLRATVPTKPAAPRRFFKPSGIRLASNTVRFPASILQNSGSGVVQGHCHSAWGPAGFGGFGNDDHVMKRGFGLSYGGYGQSGVAADANRVEEEAEEVEEEEEEELGRGRRRARREVEEMVGDGNESE
jgi:hypothetical protein